MGEIQLFKSISPLGLFLVVALATTTLVAAAVSINLSVLYFENFSNHG